MAIRTLEKPTFGAASVTATGREPLRVIVVDDEALARARLCALLAAREDVTVVGEGRASTQLADLVASTRPHVAFVDVDMPGPSVFAVWRDLRVPERPALVLATGHVQYGPEAFEARAMDYLLKPIRRDRLAEVLSRVRASVIATPANVWPHPLDQRIILKSGADFHFLERHEIVRLEAQNDLVRVHTVRGELRVRQTLSGLLERLPPHDFLRVHRSHVVNLRHVQRISVCVDGDYSVTLTGGQVAPVARALTDVIRQLLP